MATISVNFNENIPLRLLSYTELCQQQLPIKSVFLCKPSSRTGEYEDYPVKYEFKECFEDFCLPLQENVQEAYFPISKNPTFRTESGVQLAFFQNVLMPICECLNESFEIVQSLSIKGNGTPDFTLLNHSTKLPFLVVEVKQWNAFNSESREDLENMQVGSEAIKNCVGLPSGFIYGKKEKNETNGQYNCRLGMQQLIYYLFSMEIKEAYGLLTSYCHSFFVILRHTEQGNFIILSPVVRFCDRDALKKFAEFIHKAFNSEREEIEKQPVKISPMKTRQGTEFGKREGKSKKRGRNEEEKEAEIKKDIKSARNNDNGQQCCYLYKVTDLIAEGRHGSVFRILDNENCPFLAKCIPDKCNKDIICEFQNEKRMYHKLQDLQGKVLPRFYFTGLMDGWRDTIVIEQLTAVPISKCDYLSEEEKVAIADSLEEIHKKGILHCDIRSDNILIDRCKNKAYFVDFAFSREGSSEEFKSEMNDLRVLLSNF